VVREAHDKPMVPAPDLPRRAGQQMVSAFARPPTAALAGKAAQAAMEALLLGQWPFACLGFQPLASDPLRRFAARFRPFSREAGAAGEGRALHRLFCFTPGDS
jgi:hypothetical protein